MRGRIWLAVVASAVMGCGPAGVGDEGLDSGGEDVGEVSQALGFWGVTFQQGQPAQLCGPTTNDPCTVFAAKYAKTEDTTVRAASPRTNYGSETTLTVSTISVNSFDVALIKWDLRQLAGALPANATLTGARLTLSVTVADAAHTYAVAQSVVPWSEATATWDGWSWRDHLRLASLGRLEPTAPGNAVISLNVDRFAPVLKTWLADHNKNYGLWIGHPGALAPRIAFRSSETALAAAAPKLQLWFRTP